MLDADEIRVLMGTADRINAAVSAICDDESTDIKPALLRDLLVEVIGFKSGLLFVDHVRVTREGSETDVPQA